MKDFTEGSIVKALISLAVPVVMTNMLQTAYQLTDTFWVGRLGQEAVAAVSLSFPVIFLMMSLGMGFSIAGTILVAQYKGKGDMEKVQHITTQTMALMFVISLVLSTVGFFISGPVMRLIGAGPEVIGDATMYMKISFLGMIFMFTFFVYQSLMRGIGDVKTPMKIVFCTVMLNLILDPLFINGFGSIEGHGVTGAAIATVCTQGISALVGLGILFRGNKGIKLDFKGFKFDLKLIKQMFFLGLPASIEQSMKALGFTVMSFLVASFGTMIVAAYGIGFRMLSFVIIPAFGLSMATSTLVGQNMGAGKPERAEEIAKTSSTVGFITLMVAGILFGLFAEPIIAAFVPGELDVIREGAFFLKILSLGFGFLGFQITMNGAFQGSGNTRTTMLFSIVSLWVFEFPLTYILSKHTSLGSTGLWIAPVLSGFLSAIVSLSYFKLGKWKNTKVVDVEEKLEQEVLLETMVEEGF